jgi:hypothetical protein
LVSLLKTVGETICHCFITFGTSAMKHLPFNGIVDYHPPAFYVIP